MAKSNEEKLREKLNKLREDATKKELKQAEEFSKSVSKTEKELLDLFKLAEKLQKKLDSKDIKEVTKATEELEGVIEDISSIMNKTTKNIDKYSDMLNDDFSSLSNSMEMSDKALSGLSSALDKANQKIKESEKTAEATLKEWERSAKDSIKNALGFSNSYSDYLTNGFNRVLTNTRDIQNKLIRESKSFNDTRFGLIKGMNVAEMKTLVEQLQDQNDAIDKYFEDMGDEISDALKETYTKVKAQNAELLRDVGAQLNEFEQTTGSFAKSLSQASDDIRDAITSLEVDQILQSLSDQVDGFIENRRQILARVSEDFDVDRLSDTISKAMSNAHYTMSRNEMSEVAQEFIKTTRIQNLDTVDDYLSDIAAMQKAYGTSVDNLSTIMWQDINSNANNQLFRGVSNIAASLENNANLYTSADAILEAINEKAGDMYGIARGDVKRQKELMKSVATIQAIEQTSANKGISALSENLSDLSTRYATRQQYVADTQFQQLRVISGMSEEELYKALQGGDIGSVYKNVHGRMQNWNDSYYAQDYYNELFGGSVGAKAFASMSSEDINKTLEEISKSLSEGENTNGILASNKADKLTSWLDEAKNRISDNPLVKFVSDKFGELDISMANAAHTIIVATNFVKFFANLDGNILLIKKAALGVAQGFSKLGGLVTRVFSGLPAFGSKLLNGFNTVGNIFSQGLSRLQGFLTNSFPQLATKIGGFIGKFAGPLAGVAGVLLTVKDAIGGWKKSKEWLGEEQGSTLSGKVSSALGGAIGGTGPGVGEGKAFDVAKNIGGNALKGGALGFAVAGPIGAGVGALLGAVAGAIGGKRIAQFAKKTWDTIAGFGKKAFGFVVDGIDKGVENLVEFTSDKGPLVRGFGNVLENQWNMLKETGNNIKDLWEDPNRGIFSKLGGTILEVIKVPFKNLAAIGKGMFEGVTSWFNDLKDKIFGIFTKIGEKILGIFNKAKAIKEDYDRYKENGGKFGVVGYGATKAAGWVKDKLGFAGGLSKVPNDGLAYVHAGEAILTKAQAVMARSDGGIDMGRVAAAGIGTALGGPLGGVIGLGIFESIGLTKELAGKLFKGLLDSIKSDETESEETLKFHKALRKFFGIGITGGDEGTSGSSGVGGIFGNFIDKFKGLFGGGSTSKGGTTTTSGSGGGSSDRSTGTAYSGSPQLASGGNYQNIRNQDLGSFSSMSLEDMNSWINSIAPENSPFRNNGSMFLKASQESGLDPRYILAHAALESDWGRDSKAAKSNNYFGYGAFDSNISNMYKYSYDSMEEGITGIANKIANGYYKKGQTSLYSMRNNGGVHQYATDPNWDTKIASIMATAPENSGSVPVTSYLSTGDSINGGDWVKNALAYKDYREGANNDTLFGTWIGSPNQPWCAAFVSWALAQAGVSGLKSAAVSGLRDQAIKLGIYHDKNDGYIPGYGDIFINKGGKASHTGFVLSSDGESFQTIEGNAGDMVKTLTRRISDSAVSGFISLGNSGTYGGGLPVSTEDANSLSTYAQGTPWIPEDQLALVHQGEMIVPAEFNPLNNMEDTNRFNTVNNQNSNSNKEVIGAISMVVSELGKKLDTLISLQSRVPYKKTTANSDSAYLMYNT